MGQVFKGRRKHSHFSSTDSKVSPNIVSHPGESTHRAAAVTQDTKAYAGCIFFFVPGTFIIFWQTVHH